MPSDNRAPSRVTLSGARDAYFRGEFEHVLGMVDALPRRDAAEIVEVELLRARALLPLDRADEALRVLRGLRLVDRPPDEYLTAQMLMGAAYVRLGQTQRGVEILAEAHASASSAHRTVRAEIALNLGIAQFRNGNYGSIRARLLRPSRRRRFARPVRTGARPWRRPSTHGDRSAFISTGSRELRHEL